MNFHDFLLEYSFKDVLPPGTQRIYPVNFEQDEVETLNSIDDWEFFNNKNKPRGLCTSFEKGKEYKMGISSCNAIMFMNCYRDRYILHLHFFDDTKRFGSVFKTQPCKIIDPIIIPKTTKAHLLRKLNKVYNTNILQQD